MSRSHFPSRSISVAAIMLSVSLGFLLTPVCSHAQSQPPQGTRNLWTAIGWTGSNGCAGGVQSRCDYKCQGHSRGSSDWRECMYGCMDDNGCHPD